MKKNMLVSRYILFALLVIMLGGISYADFSASEFVSNFNSLNSGKGYVFYRDRTTDYPEIKLAMQSGTAPIDFSAYSAGHSTGGTNYFTSFCIEPLITNVAADGYGRLNYSGGVSKTSDGATINLGTAVLYSQFASGNLDNYGYSPLSDRIFDSTVLRTAIQATMRLGTVSNWQSNVYLAQLLAINSSQSYWMGAYDPNLYYAEVGDYAVFAMNMYESSGQGAQDFIYVTTRGSSGGEVPEPAMVLLWSLGGLGALGAARKRRPKK